MSGVDLGGGECVSRVRAALRFKVAFACEPQHFSSTWWQGDRVRPRVHFWTLSTGRVPPFTVSVFAGVSTWGMSWISAEWIDVGGVITKAASPQRRIIGRCAHNREDVTELTPVDGWRTGDGDFMWLHLMNAERCSHLDSLATVDSPGHFYHKSKTGKIEIGIDFIQLCLNSDWEMWVLQ